MNSALKLETRTFPSRIADLGFTAQLPADWIAHDLPAEEPDFSNPTTFFPLAIVTAPHAAIVFAFAARPAYDDGTLHDWTWYFLEQNQLTPRTAGPMNIGALPAVVGEATQPSDLGTMLVRFAFFEDGGRLIHFTFSAPELLADSVRDAWFALLNSFTLTTPRGSRFQADPRAAAESAPPVAPAAEAPPAPAQETNTAARPARIGFATFAIADNDASLSADHPINAALRASGAGLVPEVIATDDQAKFAIVAAESIRAQFRVPFGWHVMDDGGRALIFDPRNEVQIHLHQLDRDGRDNQAIFDGLEAETRASHPNPEFLRMKESGIEMLGVRGIAEGDQPLEQYHLLRAARQKHLVLCACITTRPQRNVDALNLAGLILKSVDFSAFPEPEDAAGEQTEKARRKELIRAREAEGQAPLPPQCGADVADDSAAEPRRSPVTIPDWWQQALAQEAGGNFEAAELIIADNVQYLGYAASTAEMYRQRMNRLKAAGDEAGALEAFKKADWFIWRYASLATSGGEGAALSYERDKFRAQLVAEFGSDPDAG